MPPKGKKDKRDFAERAVAIATGDDPTLAQRRAKFKRAKVKRTSRKLKKR